MADRDSIFCSKCRNLLTIQTNTGLVVRYCEKCKIEYSGKDDNTLIFSTFDPKNTTCNIQNILKLAPYDRINETVRKECVKCGKRKYMVRVILNNDVYFCCDNEACRHTFKGAEEE